MKNYYKHKPEKWDTTKCARAAKHIATDGLGTPYGFRGYIGDHYGSTRYNGGCIRGGEWWEGEIKPLPEIATGYRLEYVPTWGWRIVKEGGSQ